MGDLESERKMVISIMKSIIVSVKGGLPFHKLDGDYREQNGQRIPYNKFGFRSLEDFVRSISEVRISRGEAGMMLAVVDPKMAHIKSLLDRQKPAKKRIRPQKRSFTYPRSNYGRQGARPVSRMGGGYAYRPAVSAPMAPMRPPPVRREPQAPVDPRRPPLVRREPQAPVHSSNRGRERGNGDGGRSATTLVAFQPEQVGYSDTHAIRQGPGFVEYIPLDNPPPPRSEVSSRQPPPRSEVSSRQPPPRSEVSTRGGGDIPPPSNVERKSGEDKLYENGTAKGPLSEKYSDFLHQIKEKRAASTRVNGHLEPDRNGDSGRGRGRGLRKPDDAPTGRESQARPVRERLDQTPDPVVANGRESQARPVRERLGPRPDPVVANGRESQARPVRERLDQRPDPVVANGRESQARPVRERLGPRPDLVVANGRESQARPVRERLGPRPDSVVANGVNHEPHDPANRTVEYVEAPRGVGDGALTVTIANDSVAEDDDDDENWLDYDENEEDEESYVAYHKLLLRPKFRNHQLIGDDFLLHFANYIDEPCQQKAGCLTECGLCISGQTVAMCVNEIHESDILSDRVILLIGAVDIVQGMDFSTLKLRMISLLTELLDKNIKCVYICTIPPLFRLNKTKHHVRKDINTFIKSLESEKMRVIDLETEPFIDEHNQLCESYFEEDMIQTVNPSSPSITLPMWNRQGLQVLRNLIQKWLG